MSEEQILMKVWVVEGDDFEDQEVRSVWSTEKLAKADYKLRIDKGETQITINWYVVDPKDGIS